MAANFGRGAYAKGSKVIAAKAAKVTTSIVSLPKTKYGQRKKKR